MKTLAQYLAEYIVEEVDRTLKIVGFGSWDTENMQDWLKSGLEAYESTEGVTVSVVKTDEEMHKDDGYRIDSDGYLVVGTGKMWRSVCGIPQQHVEPLSKVLNRKEANDVAEVVDLVEGIIVKEQTKAPADETKPQKILRLLADAYFGGRSLRLSDGEYQREVFLMQAPYLQAKDLLAQWNVEELKEKKASKAPADVDDTAEIMRGIKEELLNRVDKAQRIVQRYGLALVNIKDIEKSRWNKSCGYDQEVNNVVIEALLAGEAIDKGDNTSDNS